MNRVFGISVDGLALAEAAARVIDLAFSDNFHYVVTPNADHILNLSSDEDFRRAYNNASLTVADGWPVVVSGRLLGANIPERVAGSDLVPAVLSLASRKGISLSVFVLGGLGDVPERAARKILREYPGVRIAGYMSPPFGFDGDPTLSAAVAETVASTRPNLIIVGLGSPKQEKWVHSQMDRLPPGVAVCAGATVDFMAGSVKRAPRWVARIGLEWMYRTLQEPRRMFRRYARVAIVFPWLLVREWSSRLGVKATNEIDRSPDA